MEEIVGDSRCILRKFEQTSFDISISQILNRVPADETKEKKNYSSVFKND